MTTDTCSTTARLRRCLPRLAPPIRDEDSFATLGIDSLDTVEFLCAVHEEFGVRLTTDEFHPAQTFSELAALIGTKATTPHAI